MALLGQFSGLGRGRWKRHSTGLPRLANSVPHSSLRMRDPDILLEIR